MWCSVIRISPFANRLAMNVPPHVQFLRCLANYEALRFSAPILTLGRTLGSRMAERSSRTGGKYVSVHLRFEEVRTLILTFSIISWANTDLSWLKTELTAMHSMLSSRIWWPSLAVCMMGERRKSPKWIQLEKKDGSRSLNGKIVLFLQVKTELKENVR